MNTYTPPVTYPGETLPATVDFRSFIAATRQQAGVLAAVEAGGVAAFLQAFDHEEVFDEDLFPHRRILLAPVVAGGLVPGVENLDMLDASLVCAVLRVRSRISGSIGVLDTGGRPQNERFLSRMADAERRGRGSVPQM